MIETILAGMIVGQLNKNKDSIMVLLEVFFGLGALIIPLIAAYFIYINSWNYVFLIVSMVVFVSIILWLVLRFDEYEHIMIKSKVLDDETFKNQKYQRQSYPLIFFGALFFFFYVGIEMSFPNYLPSILSMKTNYSASTLALSITIFGAAMTIGRAFLIFALNRVGVSKLFFICVIAI